MWSMAIVSRYECDWCHRSTEEPEPGSFVVAYGRAEPDSPAHESYACSRACMLALLSGISDSIRGSGQGGGNPAAD